MSNELQTFSKGAGIADPGSLPLTLQVIGVSVALLVFTWVLVHIVVALTDEQISASEAFWNALKAVIVLVFVVSVIFL